MITLNYDSSEVNLMERQREIGVQFSRRQRHKRYPSYNIWLMYIGTNRGKTW